MIMNTSNSQNNSVDAPDTSLGFEAESSSRESQRKNELWLALRNGVKLIISLVVTLGIAFAVRFWMPRFLGPDSFGVLHFSEGFAVMFFIFATLGADPYIRKNVAVRPEHASEFFGVLLVVQFAIGVLATLLMTIILFGMDKDWQVFRLVYLFAAGQMFFMTNSKLVALLQAKGSVNAIAILNSLSKVLWGAGIFFGLIVWKKLEVVGAVFLLTELLKTPFFFRACRKHLNLSLQYDWGAGRAMLLASFPFFLNGFAHTIAGRVDVVMMSALTVDQEVGWYGAAANINYLALLVMPIISAVVTPMSARIATHGEEELNSTMRVMVRLVLLLSVPLALLVALNSDDLVLLLFNTEYIPSANTLRVMASAVPLGFISTMLAIQLIQLEKIWTVTKVSLVSLALNPLLNGLCIVPVYEWLGDGGAGLAAASATVITQLTVVLLMLRSLRKAAFDIQTGLLLLRFAALCGIYIAVHYVLAPIGMWRGLIEVILYPVLALPLGLFPVKEFIKRGKEFLANRRKNS